MTERVHALGLHRLPVGEAELEAVEGGLAAVMLVGEQVVVDVLLGEGSVNIEYVTVNHQVAVDGDEIESVGQVRRLIIHVVQRQQLAADGGSGSLINRQSLVGGQVRRVVRRGDGDGEGLVGRCGTGRNDCRLLVGVLGEEGEAVAGVLIAIMGVGEQVVVDVLLGEGVIVGQGRTVERQRPVSRRGTDGEGQVRRAVLGVGHLQLRGGDADGFILVHRQAVVGQYRRVVYRVDGDDEDRVEDDQKRIDKLRIDRLAIGEVEFEAVLGGLRSVVLVSEQVVVDILLGEGAVHIKRLPVQHQVAVGGGGGDGVGEVGGGIIRVVQHQVSAADGAAALLVHRQSLVGGQYWRIVHRVDGDLERLVEIYLGRVDHPWL